MQANARRTSTRPGYIFDHHIRFVEELHASMDKASEEYDNDADVVDDFQAYVKDWAKRRDEKRKR
jgi:hypothetical protein